MSKKKNKNKNKNSNNKTNNVKKEIKVVEEVEELENEIQENTAEETKEVPTSIIEQLDEKEVETDEKKEYVINDYEVITERKKWPIVLGASIAVLIFLIFIFCLGNHLNTNVYSNVYLGNTKVGGMSSKQVEETLNSISKKYSEDVKIDIVQDDTVINTLTPKDINFEVDVEKTYKKVFDFGRKSNLITNNLNILNALLFKKEISIEFKYDKEKLIEEVEVTCSALKNKVIDDSFEIDEETHVLSLAKGRTGNGVNEKELEKDLIEKLKANKNIEYKIKTVKNSPKKLNADELYKKIKRDAKNAEVIEEPGKKPVFHKEIYGHDIDKNLLTSKLQELEKSQEGTTIDVKLNVIEPKVKYQDIAWTRFEDVLGTLTTRFPASNKNRATNLSIVLARLNGAVIMPGEVFSFNRYVGDCTAAKGYKPAATFKGGTVVDEVGGGICQAVSTLYNSVLYANLEIVQRKAHGLAVGYVRPSLDATVYYPAIDFKFKNNRNYPVKITTSFSWNGNMSVTIMGTKEEVEYKVELSSKKISTKPFETKVEIDPNMAPGTEKVKHNGVPGYTSEAYKVTKLNGKVVSTKLLSRDTYKPTTKIVVRGPDAPTTPTTPQQGGETVEVPDGQVETPEEEG